MEPPFKISLKIEQQWLQERGGPGEEFIYMKIRRKSLFLFLDRKWSEKKKGRSPIRVVFHYGGLSSTKYEVC